MKKSDGADTSDDPADAIFRELKPLKSNINAAHIKQRIAQTLDDAKRYIQAYAAREAIEANRDLARDAKDLAGHFRNFLFGNRFYVKENPIQETDAERPKLMLMGQLDAALKEFDSYCTIISEGKEGQLNLQQQLDLQTCVGYAESLVTAFSAVNRGRAKMVEAVAALIYPGDGTDKNFRHTRLAMERREKSRPKLPTAPEQWASYHALMRRQLSPEQFAEYQAQIGRECGLDSPEFKATHPKPSEIDP